jgi:hypothetical protein
MLNTIKENFDGVELVRPLGDFMWPHVTFDGFPTCCGAGPVGDKFIPDTIHGINVSPACWVHDQMWTIAEASWGDFHYSNSILLLNLSFIIQAKSRNRAMCDLRLARAATYWLGVSVAGSSVFWGLKSGGK